jgi:sec-independent protein translocase protein TatA
MRILKSEAKAMKSDGASAGDASTASTTPAPDAIAPSEVVTATETQQAEPATGSVK